jgi:hypothetical protein
LTPKPAKNKLKYWCRDETRIGLKTIERKRITAWGVKPLDQGKRILTLTQNMLQLNLTKFPCSWL